MTFTDTTALAGIVEAIEEDTDDELAWRGLADWLADSGARPIAWTSTVLARALALQAAFALLARTHDGCARIENVSFHHDNYAEPGYSVRETGLAALGNWNSVSHWTPEDTTPERFGTALERLGVQLEWEDEWVTCDQCGRLVRTQPDSWGWTPSYSERCLESGEFLCLECAQANED